MFDYIDSFIFFYVNHIFILCQITLRYITLRSNKYQLYLENINTNNKSKLHLTNK
jgi:hypothetical protein